MTLRAKTADRVVAEYVMCRFDEKKGTKLSLVKHALLGVQHTFPHLRGHLNVSWANLKTWEEQRLSSLTSSFVVASHWASPCSFKDRQ